MFYAQGVRAATPYHNTVCERAPIDLISIDTADPYVKSLGSSWYVDTLNDSTVSFQWLYGTRDKNASNILALLKCFVEDMELPRALRTNIRSERTNLIFVDFLRWPGDPSLAA